MNHIFRIGKSAIIGIGTRLESVKIGGSGGGGGGGGGAQWL